MRKRADFRTGMCGAVASMGIWATLTAAAANAQAAEADDTPPAIQSSATTLPALEVQATREAAVGLVARRSAAGTKTDTPIEEIPQTLNVITAEQIDATGSTTVNEALRYLPGVSGYSMDGRSDWFAAIRGFRPSVFVDGLQVPNTTNLSTWAVDPYMIDSIAVLRGPASILYGQGDPGATADVVTKQADGERVREAQFQLGNSARKQLAFDIGDKLDPSGVWSYRIVATARDANAATGPNADRRVALAPSIRWRPDARTSLTIAGSYLQDWSDVSSNLLPASGTVLPNPNGRISPDLYTGDSATSFFRRRQWSIGYRFEHELDNVWTLRQNARYMRLSMDSSAMMGGGLDPFDPSGATMMRLAGRFQPSYSRLDVDNQAQARFVTGPLEHTVLTGFEYNRQTSVNSMAMGPGPGLNLFDGSVVALPPALQAMPPTAVSTTTTADMFGLYAQDQIKWRRWVLTVGGREDWSFSTQDDHRSGARVQQNEHAFTGRAGVSYLGDFGLSPYVSYSTSFNPVIGVNLAGGGIPVPTKGRQIEAGLRWRVPGRNLMLSAALYQIDQTHVAVPSPDDPTSNFYIQTGKIRSRGFEFSAVGNVTRELSVVAAYAYQDVKNTSATGDAQDKWPVDLPHPRQMASLWGDWTWRTGPLAGLGFGAGIRYQSGVAGAADNSLYVPSYTLYDAAVHYDAGSWRFSANAHNLFDRRAVSGCQSATACAYGGGRSVIASATYYW
ncbi:TonB-dependent siderophore receptor [Burkholderia multivorans]|nr:TonB-dependent siderophore receptor [Burkholderia multivorans]MBU9436485.1 TonB-dependent siderophore receptor [Burkholderia multivorans]